jgi:hypothetical protein
LNDFSEVTVMEKRKAYEEKLAAQLAEWNAQVALYKAKADRATAEAKIEYCKITETLQHKQEEGRTKLQELKASSDEAWGELKTGGENAWTEIKVAFHAASAKFK